MSARCHIFVIISLLTLFTFVFVCVLLTNHKIIIFSSLLLDFLNFHQNSGNWSHLNNLKPSLQSEALKPSWQSEAILQSEAIFKIFSRFLPYESEHIVQFPFTHLTGYLNSFLDHFQHLEKQQNGILQLVNIIKDDLDDLRTIENGLIDR